MRRRPSPPPSPAPSAARSGLGRIDCTTAHPLHARSTERIWRVFFLKRRCGRTLGGLYGLTATPLANCPGPPGAFKHP
jgi:hypothetical protein